MNNNHLYCTAIIQSTGKIPYLELVAELKKLEDLTNKEPGCISFQVIPMSEQEQQFALWEVWTSEEGFYAHHNMDYTQRYFAKEITELKLFESSRGVNL